MVTEEDRKLVKSLMSDLSKIGKIKDQMYKKLFDADYKTTATLVKAKLEGAIYYSRKEITGK